MQAACRSVIDPLALVMVAPGSFTALNLLENQRCYGSGTLKRDVRQPFLRAIKSTGAVPEVPRFNVPKTATQPTDQRSSLVFQSTYLLCD